ncbi:MAG: vWA domain-containing protein [Pseudomonadota bacterium]
MNKSSFNSKIVALALCLSTAIGIAAFPIIQQARAITTPVTVVNPQAHRIEVVFILDTTSSMSGLIQAAKEKIWSIASTMASAQQNPDIKMGLVAFRDRGDAYVTRVFDLSEDLDSMYANLMDFRAQGGGDGPESVNQALYDAIHKISWSQDEKVYKVAFLVGDAPPHMDYADEVQYPVTLSAAKRKGIVVNTIQSGQHAYTRPAWKEIAALGTGEYFQVENSGNAVAVSTPFDEKLATLAAELEDTRLFYGDSHAREQQERKRKATDKLKETLSTEALARRSSYNATQAGKKNLLGESELVEAISSGQVELDDIEEENLPASIQAMAPEQQMEVIRQKAERREALQQEIRELSETRSDYIKQKVDASGGAEDSLDEKIYRAVKDQAASIGLTYDSDSAKY